MPEKAHTRFSDDTDVVSPAKKPRLHHVQQENSHHRRGQVHPGRTANSHTHTQVTPLKQKAQSLLAGRKALPVWSQASTIRHALRQSNTLLLVGETGSGKSTQVPQILLEEPWCRSQKVTIDGDESRQKVSVGGCVAITQPRRVAAISLARRVAEEMGSTLGRASPASKVGYSVRFDNNTSPGTKIKFVTEGMLLQEMLRDPWLKQYSAIMVDEVHERGVNVDLVLGFLKLMAKGDKQGRGGLPLKVVVMSATAEMVSLQDFFGGSETQIHAGNGVGGTTERTESESEWSGFSDSSQIDQDLNDKGKIKDDYRRSHPKASRTNQHPEESRASSRDDKSKELNQVAVCHIEGRQFPVDIIYSTEPVHNIVEASLVKIFEINRHEALPGDILVFLTGQSAIESLASLIDEYAPSLSKEVPKLLALPLFAALPQSDQQSVFRPAPRRIRKVIISTNIAETSVTIPGVRFVVDCGKSKVKQFRSKLALNSLLAKPISKSAAIQRAGRAGREAPGKCYRLYTKAAFEGLEQDTQPEMLRCDLTHTVLTLKARGVSDLAGFPFLSPPSRDALYQALLQLSYLDALDSRTADITPLGRAMARLPLSAPMGRALLAAAEPDAGCLAEMIDVVAALSIENVFLPLTNEEQREKAEEARKSLMNREGDHMTLLAVVRGYVEENSDRKRWAESRWISHRAMQSVMDARKQLRELAPELEKLAGEVADAVGESANGGGGEGRLTGREAAVSSSPQSTVLLKALLKGFLMNTALRVSDGSYQTCLGRQSVAMHPSSVLFGRKVEAIMYSEYVFTTKSYARSVSAIEPNWIEDAFKV